MIFLIIRRFLMYFADFRANFCVYEFYYNNFLQFCGQESIFG